MEIIELNSQVLDGPPIVFSPITTTIETGSKLNGGNEVESRVCREINARSSLDGG